MKKCLFLLVLLINIFFLYRCGQNPEPGTKQFNSIYQKLQNATYKDYDSLFVLYKEIDSLNDKKHDRLFLYLKLTAEGRLYFRKSEYQKAIDKFQKANNIIVNQKGNDSLVVKNLNAIGAIFNEYAKYDSANYYLRKAQVLADKISDKSYLQAIQTNLALTNYYRGELKLAFQLVDEIIKNPATKSLELGAYHIKANILGQTGKINEAIKIDQDMLKKYSSDKKNYLVSAFYNNLGLCYLEKGNLDSAIYCCKLSFKTDSLSGIKKYMGANLLLLGNIYNSKGRSDLADSCYYTALNLLNDNQNIDGKLMVYEVLTDNAVKKQGWKSVAEFKDSVTTLYKKINSIEMNRTIELLNIEYETVKKDQQIELQSSKLEFQKYIIIFISIIALMVMSLIYFLFQNRIKKNELKMIKKEQKIAMIVNEAEENLKAKIAQDLHDSIGQKLAVAQMHVSMMNSEDSVKENVLKMISQTANELRDISHTLLPVDLNKGIIPALEHLTEQMNFVNNTIKIQLKIDETIFNTTIHKDIEHVIYRMIQEIINNAIKYSGGSIIDLNLICRNKRIIISVSDNGKGFDTSTLSENKGIGIRNIISRVHRINGYVKLDSSIDKGTHYYIEIPI